jgi:hypothetical protein
MTQEAMPSHPMPRSPTPEPTQPRWTPAPSMQEATLEAMQDVTLEAMQDVTLEGTPGPRAQAPR